MGWLRVLEGVNSISEMVVIVDHMRVQRKWKYSTTLTKLGEIVGALRRREYYASGCRLNKVEEDQEFKDYERVIRHGALQEQVNYPKAVLREDLHKAIKNLLMEERIEVAVLLLLVWSTAARVACALKLRKENIEISGQEIKIRFVEGKGVFARKQPYTVHTHLGQWTQKVQSFLNRTKTSELFPVSQWNRLRKGVSEALKGVDRAYELRSLRRGSLVTMAQRGVPLEVVRHFSGHTNDNQCLRYLEWGWHHGNMHQRGVRAAQYLW